MIGEWINSPIRCRCGKRMVMDLGQDADTGWVHEHHSCLDCGAEVRERSWPHKTTTVRTVAELVRLRSRHLDRGKSLTPAQIALMSREEFEEWANGGT